MVETVADIRMVIKTAEKLEGMGVPRKTCDKIRRWAHQEEKRLRDENLTK